MALPKELEDLFETTLILDVLDIDKDTRIISGSDGLKRYLALENGPLAYMADYSTNRYKLREVLMDQVGISTLVFSENGDTISYEIHQSKETLPGDVEYTYTPLEDFLRRMDDGMLRNIH